MTVITNYFSNEKADPSLIEMWVPTLNKTISYKNYIYLMRVMGLKRDIDQTYWVGGWPVFLYPNGNVFALAKTRESHLFFRQVVVQNLHE